MSDIERPSSIAGPGYWFRYHAAWADALMLADDGAWADTVTGAERDHVIAVAQVHATMAAAYATMTAVANMPEPRR